jgi:cytochrome c oxidase subunit IV
MDAIRAQDQEHREPTDPSVDPQAGDETHGLESHPSPAEYVKIAVILAIATAIEVAWYYLDVPRSLFIAALMVLAVLKFSLVVLWFMHLRFDSRIYRRLFVTGLLLAIAVYLIVLVSFGLFF